MVSVRNTLKSAQERVVGRVKKTVAQRKEKFFGKPGDEHPGISDLEEVEETTPEEQNPDAPLDDDDEDPDDGLSEEARNTKLYGAVRKQWGNGAFGEKAISDYMFRKILESANPNAVRDSDNGFKIKVKKGGKVEWALVEQEGNVPAHEAIRGRKHGFNDNDAATMVALAKMHGWKSIEVHGTQKQKDKIWLAAQRLNIEMQVEFPEAFEPLIVKGFQPSEAAMQQAQLDMQAFYEERGMEAGGPAVTPAAPETPVAETPDVETPAAETEGARKNEGLPDQERKDDHDPLLVDPAQAVLDAELERLKKAAEKEAAGGDAAPPKEKEAPTAKAEKADTEKREGYWQDSQNHWHKDGHQVKADEVAQRVLNGEKDVTYHDDEGRKNLEERMDKLKPAREPAPAAPAAPPPSAAKKPKTLSRYWQDAVHHWHDRENGNHQIKMEVIIGVVAGGEKVDYVDKDEKKKIEDLAKGPRAATTSRSTRPKGPGGP